MVDLIYVGYAAMGEQLLIFNRAKIELSILYTTLLASR